MGFYPEDPKPVQHEVPLQRDSQNLALPAVDSVSNPSTHYFTLKAFENFIFESFDFEKMGPIRRNKS